MANRIVLNETSYHGAGSIQVIKDEVLRRGFKKAFVCTDPDLIKFGVADKVTAVLDEVGYLMKFIQILKQIQQLKMFSME